MVAVESHARKEIAVSSFRPLQYDGERMFSWVVLLVSIVVVLPVGAADTAKEKSTANGAATPAPAAPRLASAAQRNENVAVYQIDNDAIKEANIRVGTTSTLVSEIPVDSAWLAAEHGRPAGEQLLLRPLAAAPPGWHGELFEMHQNAVFNARAFFQVGSVLPSHRNVYGGRLAGEVKKLGALTGGFQQRKIRGMVNGNILVPLPEERAPLAVDPRVREVVSRLLAAYPRQAPNRPDFDPRALNTNAPQQVDEIDGTLRLDRQAGSRGRLTLFQSITRNRIDAFQLVAGQNPDSSIHFLRSRINYRRSLSPVTDLAVGLSFQRVRSLLISEPNAVGPRVRFGYQIEELGPDSQYPIDRAQNSFRYGAVVSHRAHGGVHQLSFGGDVYRYRLNGIESANQRGQLQFTNNFGRSAIENLRLGTPSTYETSLGELSRGYRNWAADLFVADRYKVSSRLQLYFGLRYSLETGPVEVDALDSQFYACDCNNFSPRLSVAYQAGAGLVIRTSYSISFGPIPPVTFQQGRNNLPNVRYVIVQNPDLLDLLGGVDLHRNSPTLISPHLVAPYSHQYNFSLERGLFDRYLVRFGYIGSRTIKLFNVYTNNRAIPIDGIPLSTATVDQRRTDPNYYDIRHVVNGGIAYFDGAQASIEIPLHHGLVANVAYTFSKAIDEGTDFAFTAANKDMLSARSQSQDDVLKDKKGLSNFDSTHAFSMAWSYDLPARPSGTHLRWLTSGWQISGITLLKSGTPLTLFVGSDAPGLGNVDGGPSDRPNIIDPSILGMTISHPDVAPQILRRDRFAYIRPGQSRGSLARNSFRKAGIANLNGAVTKQWRWSGRSERLAMFRAEAFNLTNTPQFDEPQRNLSSPSFGRITNTLNDGRVFQLVLRFIL